MKKEPCIKFGIRIRPKISEKPADSRNNSPPYAMLFTPKVSQSDMSDASGQHASRDAPEELRCAYFLR